MTATPSDDFDRTMQALELGRIVRSIRSRPLVTIGPDADPAALFAAHAHLGFDCPPVREGGHVPGRVDKADLNAAPTTAVQSMRPLLRPPSIAPTEPVIRLISTMRETGEHVWLVPGGNSIDAMVTRSDLFRLPVRTIAISRVIHLEQLPTQLIGSRSPGASWLERLPPKRRTSIRARVATMQKRNEELDPLEHAPRSDKLTVPDKAPGRRVEADELGGIVELRNALTHGRDPDDDFAGLMRFLDRLDRFERLDPDIDRWTREPATPRERCPLAVANAGGVP